MPDPANSETTTINPEVVPAGTAVRLNGPLAISDKAAWLSWGILLGIGATLFCLWYAKKRL